MRPVRSWWGLICMLCAACGGGQSEPGPGAPGAPKADVHPPAFRSMTGVRDGAALYGVDDLVIEATDDVGITLVTLALDGQQVATSNEAVLHYRLDTTLHELGEHVFSLRAIDASGKIGRAELRVTFVGSEPEPVPTPDPPPPASEPEPDPKPQNPQGSVTFVSSNGGDNLPKPPAPPTVDETDISPPSRCMFMDILPGQIVHDKVSFGVLGMDNREVWRMEVWFGGKEVAFATEVPYLYLTLDTETVEDGFHYINARIVDYGGNYAQCAIQVQVSNALDHEPPRFGPYVRFYPAVRGELVLTPYIIEDQELASTEFLIEGNLTHTSTEQEPKFPWNTLSHQDGVYKVEIKATDKSGKSATDTVWVEVANSLETYTISGKLYAPNGVDPLPGMRLRIPKRFLAEPVLTAGLANSSYGVDASAGELFTETAPDGSFSISGVPPGQRQLQLLRGNELYERSFRFTRQLQVSGNLVLGADKTSLPASNPGPQLAVVTGDDEGIGDMLARLGYGSVDSAGRLVLGSQKFILVDGNDSLPAGDYPDLPEFLADQALLETVDIMFICAGNAYEEQLVNTPALKAGLHGWLADDAVHGSPKPSLYCGGNAYDFIEQCFPDAMLFNGSSDDYFRDLEAEPWNAAESAVAEPANRAYVNYPTHGTGQPVLVQWLNKTGFPALLVGEDFAQALPAGAVRARTRFDNIGLLRQVVPTDSTSSFADIYLCSGSVYGAYEGYVHFGTLPIPAERGAQPTLQERLLTWMLYRHMN